MNAQQRAEWMQFCTSPEAQDELMRAWANETEGDDDADD